MVAQIKLKDANNTSFTFYQTKLNRELRHIPLGTVTQDNVTIIQWRENGLFMALAYTRDPQDFP